MKKNQNFEEKLQELEQIVAILEKGELNLEDSVKKFEEGMNLSKECSKLLDNAQKRITLILNENGEIKEEDLCSED